MDPLSMTPQELWKRASESDELAGRIWSVSLYVDYSGYTSGTLSLHRGVRGRSEGIEKTIRASGPDPMGVIAGRLERGEWTLEEPRLPDAAVGL